MPSLVIHGVICIGLQSYISNCLFGNGKLLLHMLNSLQKKLSVSRVVLLYTSVFCSAYITIMMTFLSINRTGYDKFMSLKYSMHMLMNQEVPWYFCFTYTRSCLSTWCHSWAFICALCLCTASWAYLIPQYVHQITTYAFIIHRCLNRNLIILVVIMFINQNSILIHFYTFNKQTK